MRPPETKFARLGRDRIAYKVFGEGPGDALFLTPPWLSVDARVALVATTSSRKSSVAGGRVAKQTGDGHLVEFERPGDAVNAALAICRDAPTLGVRVRAGVHTGEIERRESGDIGGLSVHIAARVAAVAGPGEVVVSRTVADLLGSGDHELRDRGEHELKGVPGRWQLYTIHA